MISIFERSQILRRNIVDIESLIFLFEINSATSFNLTKDFGNSSTAATSNFDDTSIVTGDVAWMLFSTALVLLMTLPGITLFYGGLVPSSKNFVATAMQSMSITCVVTFLWLTVGYSLAFAPVDKTTGSIFIGDFSRVWLSEMSAFSTNQLATTIPETIYCFFQLTFAIITPALICGSFAERMKFTALIVFMGLWHVFVYCPIAHMNWHPSGYLFQLGVLDFAGGNVVHISSGVAALLATILIGKGFGSNAALDPNNIILSLIGGSLLWVGWFGFNAGSAVSSGSRSSMAFLCTHLATSTGGLTWMTTSWILRGQPSVVGMLSGAVAGLVAITPAAGYVDPFGAFCIGFVAGPLCYLGTLIKTFLGYDDTLDAFGIHAIGGIVGGIMTGCFARAEICGVNGAFYGNTNQLKIQTIGILITISYTAVSTLLLLKIVDIIIGLKCKVVYNQIGRTIHRRSRVGDSGGNIIIRNDTRTSGGSPGKHGAGVGAVGGDLRVPRSFPIVSSSKDSKETVTPKGSLNLMTEIKRLSIFQLTPLATAAAKYNTSNSIETPELELLRIRETLTTKYEVKVDDTVTSFLPTTSNLPTSNSMTSNAQNETKTAWL